jgi:hypothetical protein
MNEYLIWSNEHRAWWRSDSKGYTLHVDTAGRYSRAEAIKISSHAHRGWQAGRVPDKIPVLAADALECAATHVA